MTKSTECDITEGWLRSLGFYMIIPDARNNWCNRPGRCHFSLRDHRRMFPFMVVPPSDAFPHWEIWSYRDFDNAHDRPDLPKIQWDKCESRNDIMDAMKQAEAFWWRSVERDNEQTRIDFENTEKYEKERYSISVEVGSIEGELTEEWLMSLGFKKRYEQDPGWRWAPPLISYQFRLEPVHSLIVFNVIPPNDYNPGWMSEGPYGLSTCGVDDLDCKPKSLDSRRQVVDGVKSAHEIHDVLKLQHESKMERESP